MEFVGTVGRLGFAEPDGPETSDGELPEGRSANRAIDRFAPNGSIAGVTPLAKRLFVPLLSDEGRCSQTGRKLVTSKR